MSLRKKSDLSLALVYLNDLKHIHTILILSKTLKNSCIATGSCWKLQKKWLDFVTYAYYEDCIKKYLQKKVKQLTELPKNEFNWKLPDYRWMKILFYYNSVTVHF